MKIEFEKVGAYQKHLFDNGATKIELKVEAIEEELEDDKIELKDMDDVYRSFLTYSPWGQRILENYRDTEKDSDLITYIEWIEEEVKNGNISLIDKGGNKLLMEVLHTCHVEVCDYTSETQGTDETVYVGDLDVITQEEFKRIYEHEYWRICSRIKQDRRKSFKKKFIELYKKKIDNLHEVLYTIYKKRERKY